MFHHRYIPRTAAYPISLLLLIWCLLAWPIAPVHAAACPTAAGGQITVDTSWTVTCDITQSVTVVDGATLTIAPGIDVRLNNRNFRITVNGTLNADGSAAAPIRFTSGAAVPQPGDWDRLLFSESSRNSVLDHVTVAYAGGGIGTRNPAVEIRSASVQISNSRVENNREDGIAVRDASPTINSTVLNNNGPTAVAIGRALDLSGASLPVLSGLSASRNGFDGIAVNGGDVGSDYTWGTGGLTQYLLVNQDLLIAAGATLTIVAGTTVFIDNPNADIVVRGGLVAEGSAAAPIRLSSGDDLTPGSGSIDTFIGDWGSLKFEAGSSGSIVFATIEHGGGIGAGIQIASSDVTIRDSVIARHRNGGILVSAGAPVIRENQIIANQGLGEIGLNNTGTGLVDAGCNWWGAAAGPRSPLTPGSSGQQLRGGAVFAPWRIAPDGPCSGSLVLLPFVTLGGA